jgi:glutathione S-transferase
MHLFVDHEYASPYAMSVFVALTEKQLPFEMEIVDLAAGAQNTPQFAGTSLTQRIPVLIDGDFRLAESTAITEDLDEAYPGQAFYPREPKDTARARQLQAWLRSDLLPIRVERSTATVFYRPSEQPLSTDALRAAHKLFHAAQELLAHGGDHLFGHWSIADTDLAMMLQRLVNSNDDVPPLLRAYTERQWQRPSVQAWVQRARPALAV